MPLLHLLTILQDSVVKAGQSGAVSPIHDSVTVRVPPPLPGGAATVARLLLNSVPQWVQIGGVLLGALVALVLLVLAVRHWRAVMAWFAAKSVPWKSAFAAVVVLVAGAATYSGLQTWHFMMHDNDFCSGCHVMNTPFQKFGDAANKHAKLLCHDCHQQSIFASMNELYVWVLDRPERIPPHANNVPNKVCATCHAQRDPDSTWKRVISTAGHQVHLNGKSPLFKELECIVCHAREVHRFKADDRTCGQAGCHDNTQIQLGMMANQTDLHCVTCHTFTAAALEVNAVDSAKAVLSPKQAECFSCHEMKKRLASFDAKDEPHKTGCGTCHNPHTQTTPYGAFQSCATSQCHTQADTLTAMHRGLPNHKLDNCGACHVAHTWKARATDCRSCHQDIDRDKTRTRRGARRLSELTPPPNAVGTIARLASWSGAPRSGRRVWVSIRHGTERRLFTPVAFVSPRVAADTATFSHRRHRAVPCTTCHNSQMTHGALKIMGREQCQSCHHANDERGAKCVTCHAAQAASASHAVVVPMHVDSKPVADRTLTFAHNDHGRLDCAGCHTTEVSRRVDKTCISCHEQHHTAERQCASCHADARATHTRAVHLTGCGGSGCHVAPAGASTSPVRNVCLACHSAQLNHKPGRDCSTCHLGNWSHSSGA